MRYDSLYWTNKIPYDEIRNNLRVIGKGYTSPIIVDAWVHDPPYYGLPRQWAVARQLQGADNTVLVPRKWPKFKGKYKYNQEDCCEALEFALKAKNGALLESPTGWGKTVAALEVASRMGQKTLVLVHKSDLMKQWADSARDFFGLSCGVVQQDTWDHSGIVTVAMVQTLKSRQITPEFAKDFGMVIVDEGQHIPCDTVTEILAQLPARYRLGVSATWRRADMLDVLWQYHIGEVEAQGERPSIPATAHQITPPVIVDERKFSNHGRINHAAMLTYIAGHTAYNQYIVDEILRAKDRGRQILVVSHRISQVEYFSDKIPDAGVYTARFKGKNLKAEELEAAQTKQVILATYKKVEEGTDIPRLDTLIMASPCTDPEQVVGRVSRDYPGKTKVIIVDPVLPHGYNYALAGKRKRIYEALNITIK